MTNLFRASFSLSRRRDKLIKLTVTTNDKSRSPRRQKVALRFALTCLWLVLAITPAFSQSDVDAKTLLLLRFEQSLNGEQGETPTEQSGVTFEPGILGQGVVVDSSDVLRYATAGNFHAPAGTIEFWIKPRWNGTDPTNYSFFGMGNAPYSDGSIVIQKDGASNLIYNANSPHGFFFAGIQSWTANQWHHVAITWEVPGTMRMFVDGRERSSRPASFLDVISLVPPTMTVGGFNATQQANAVIDEMRISNAPRTAQEIYSRFVSALTVNSISVSTITTNLWKTWRVTPKITANTNVGVFEVPSSTAAWSSSDPGVAFANADGQIVGAEPGSALLTANLNGAQTSLTVKVRAPVLPPRINTISSYLATPATGHLYEIPVVTIRYLPTTDGVNLDTAWAPDFASLNPIPLSTLEARLDDYDQNVKFMLEEGSRFRGYGSQTPIPSLGYRVVASITVYEPTPPGGILQTSQGHPVYGPEHFQIFERLGMQNYVNNLGVREIWFWQGGLDASAPSYDPSIHLPENFRLMSESNMSSPTTADISNGFDRSNNDLPIYNKSYVVYGQNFRRTQAEAVHNHGHQLEVMFSYINQQQAGNTELFWQKFVGRAANFSWVRGRAGDTHHPPNASTDYDYLNFTPFNSDIMDWKPDGGQTVAFSASTYGNIPYAFPVPNPPQRIESQWYIFWMQSFPGHGNTIPFGNNRMTNWWSFVGDWDASINAGLGLYAPFTPPPPAAPTIFVEEGNVNRAVALDSVTLLRGPFSVLTNFNLSGDRHTRVILFTSALGLTQPDPLKLTVRAGTTSLLVENVGTVTGVSGLVGSYIIVRLPDGLPSVDLPLVVTLNGVASSNSPTLSIAP